VGRCWVLRRRWTGWCIRWSSCWKSHGG